MNDDASLHEDLEAYVIGALDEPDRAVFERHLATCAACRFGVDEYADVRTALAAIEVSGPPRAPRLPAAERSRSRILGVATLAVAAVALATGIEVPRYAHDRSVERAYAEIARMLATADPIEVALVGAPGITGRAIVGDSHHLSGFVVRGLPQAQAGYVYRVWLRGATLRRSPGTLEMTPDGLHVLVTPGDVFERASSIRVMLEPASPGHDSPVLPRRTMLIGTID